MTEQHSEISAATEDCLKSFEEALELASDFKTDLDSITCAQLLHQKIRFEEWFSKTGARGTGKSSLDSKIRAHPTCCDEHRNKVLRLVGLITENLVRYTKIVGGEETPRDKHLGEFEPPEGAEVEQIMNLCNNEITSLVKLTALYKES